MMKKGWIAGALLCASILLFGGCTNSKKAAEATTQAKETEIVVDYSAGFSEEGRLEGTDASKLVTLCDYKNIEIKKSEVEADEDTVNQQITSILQSHGQYEGKAKKGDTVNIDYSGSINGEKFDGGTAEAQFLELGSKTFIDNFEEQIMGHTPGDNFDVNVTFPESYQAKDLAGKDAVFNVTLNYIVPELSDEFVKKTFSESDGITTVEGLKKMIKDNLRLKNEQSYIWDYLVKNCKLKEIPKDVLDKRVDVVLNDTRKQYHDYYGFNDKEILAYNKCETIEELKESLREGTEATLQRFLIADAIAAAEGIKVDEEAMEHYLGKGNISGIQEIYGKPYVNAQVLNSMVIDYLVENAKVK